MAHNEEYYKAIGFKCGLEVHQRLATERKLFCSCRAAGEPGMEIGTVERMQRAVAGELGNVDVSTSFESQKKRKFIYMNFSDTSCLVDMDEEPPHPINDDAVDTALMISASLNANVPDEIEPMRKEVVDGSDPSAFQRTMLVGYDGHISVDGREVGIPTIFLEEESSGIEKNDDESATYNVSRLGIPLVEIDTGPDLRNPEEAKKAAMAIGLLLRLTFRVQRGIGTIRQDVNVSIAGGSRVEVKGLQEIDVVDTIIENEVERQLRLIEIKKELAGRNAKVSLPVDITEIFAITGVKIIRDNVGKNGAVYGLNLVGFEGIIGREINPNRRLGSEISDYARAAGVKGIIHSDENLEAYGFTSHEIEQVKQRLNVKSGDAFAIVASGNAETSRRAAAFAKLRAELSVQGVPSETRAADSKNMVTRFMRPIPGGSRMYPETDAKPIQVDKGAYEAMLKNKVEIKKMRDALEMEIGNKQIAEQMLWSPRLSSYSFIVSKAKAKPLLVASILLEKMTEIKRQGIAADSITDDVLLEIFRLYAEGTITKAGIEEIMKRVPRSGAEVQRIIKENSLSRITGNGLRELIKKFRGPDKASTIKQLMSKYRANIDGEEMNKMLKEELA